MPTSLSPEASRANRLRAALWSMLPVLAIGTAVLSVAATIAVAGDTLGYDFLAYHAAATRLRDGQPLYDASIVVAGPFGQYLYPPPAVLVGMPFALFGEQTAIALWTALLLGASAIAIAILPVSARIRWLVLLLAGLSWPFVYAIKLGQVGPILLLLFAVGWRWMDRPLITGTAFALGATLKVQPLLLVGWALLTRRWRTVAVAVAGLLVLAVAGAVVAGPGAWAEFVGLMRQISDPVTTIHSVTLGAVAYQAGLSREVATGLQWTWIALVIGAVGYAALRRPGEPSYLVAVTASQALSPVLWDHYALILLLPVAHLLDRGRWWAAAIPLATSIAVVGVMPDWIYPVVFAVTLLALLVDRGRVMAPSPVVA